MITISFPAKQNIISEKRNSNRQSADVEFSFPYCGSESEDSEDSEDSEGFLNTFYEDLNEALIALNTEYSDDYETGSGSSENSGNYRIL